MLLFLLYINDISQSSNLVDFHLFADDTSVFYSNKDNQMMEISLNNELHNISNWLKANKLSLNVKKSNVIHINNKRSDNSQKINLCIESEMIEVKSHAKYLGVLLDDNLNWKAQIQHVNLKISKGLGILAKLRHVVPEKTLRSLYKSFIQPHIDYGSLVWGSATKSNLTKIAKSTKKAVRIMTFKQKYENTAPLFQKLNLLPLEKNILFLQAKFMWKFVHGCLPQSINEIFNNNVKNEKSKTDRLFLPYRRTNIGQRFLSYGGIKLWNEGVPSDIKAKSKISDFLSAYNKHLLSEI